MEEKIINNETLEAKFDVKETYDALKGINAMVENLRSSMNALIESYGLPPTIINEIKTLTISEIDALDITEISDLLESWGEDRDTLTSAHMKSSDHSVSYIDFAKNALKDIREAGLTVESMELERLDIHKKVQEMEREQLDFYHSADYKEKREEQINKLKVLCEQDTDSSKKRQAMEKLEILDNAKTLDFLFNRFNRFGCKEIKSIVDGFLDPSKGEYIYKRYSTNILKLGITLNVIERFYNIEELFLNDVYHPFNNLFVFIVVRFIAYMDIHNKKDVLYANSLLSKCESLIHHNFESQDDEEQFKHIIKTILNNFMTPEYTELFKQKNTTYPLHPTRVERDEIERREFHDKCISVLKKELGPEMDSRYYTCTNDELRDRLDEIYKEKIEMVEMINQGKDDVDKISVYTPYHQIKPHVQVIASPSVETVVDTDVDETYVEESEHTNENGGDDSEIE